MIRLRPVKIVHKQQGSAMVELAVIMPILILMLLGALDIGLLLRQAMIVTSSARVGAEYASTWATASNTGQMQTFASYEASINNHVPNYTVVATSVCTCGVGGASVPCNGTCIGNVQPAQYAQVTASATLPVVFGVNGFPASVPVKSIAKVRVPWRNGN